MRARIIDNKFVGLGVVEVVELEVPDYALAAWLDERTDWCFENGIPNVRLPDKDRRVFCFGFRSEEDAALFKLTFGGND